MTAANLLGLYYVALPFHVISFRSNLHPKLTVPTTFCIFGKHSSGTTLIFLYIYYILQFVYSDNFFIEIFIDIYHVLMRLSGSDNFELIDKCWNK